MTPTGSPRSPLAAGPRQRDLVGPPALRPVRPALFLVLLALGACASETKPPSPEQQAVLAQRVDAELVVTTVKNAMRYEVRRIEAPAGSTVRLVIDNSTTSSPSMQHNVVVVRTEGDVERVGRAAAGEPDHVPDDPAVLTATPLAGPGERMAVVFEMPPPGEYPFVCTYPGHFLFMQGVLVSTPPAN